MPVFGDLTARKLGVAAGLYEGVFREDMFEEAADMIAQACIFKPVRVATRLGIAGEVVHALLPRVAQIAMNASSRMFPDSSAATGDKSGRTGLSPEAVAMQQMMRGIHFQLRAAFRPVRQFHPRYCRTLAGG